ncbi:MICOS complex subunit MIC27 [Arapaima gigas]
MAVKVLKLSAIPAALGLASLRVYALSEEKTQALVSPKELTIYGPETEPYCFVEDQPGLLQNGVGAVRVGLTPYVRAVKGACISMKIGAINLYYAGEDMYHYLKDPPPGFVPRISFITVSGLAGMVLGRKGSQVKRLATSLSLASVGAAICYPAPTIGVLKLTGKRLYQATQWSASTIASLWRPSSVRHAPDVSKSPESSSESEVTAANPTSEPEPVSLLNNSVSIHVLGEEPSVAMAMDSTSPVLPEAAKEHTAVLTPVEPVLGEQLVPLPPELLLSTDDADVDTLPEKPQSTIDPKLMDHGQSIPEDADLYSTRN